MENVYSRHLQYERAGDWYVGGIVDGLPLQSEAFHVLWPYFACPDKVVEAGIPGLA